MSESSIEMDVSELGLDAKSLDDTAEFQTVVIPRPLLLRNTLLTRARSWVGHNFNGDETEQCANFVRRLLAETGVILSACEKPFDQHLTGSLEQGPSFANSFFSADLGRLLGYGDLKPGDLVAFRDTYEGDFPKGCITHVGIWAESNTMIDRSTAGEPIRALVLNDWWKERFVVGMRPHEMCD